jgi:hypothetical protein
MAISSKTTIKIKNITLTPIKVGVTRTQKNIECLNEFVKQNFEALIVGAKRGMIHDSNIILQPNKVVYGSIEFHMLSNFSVRIYCYGSDLENDGDIKACLYAIDILRDYAENPHSSSLYSLEYNSPVTYSNIEDIF